MTEDTPKPAGTQKEVGGLYDLFGTDQQSEVEGIDVEYPNGAVFTIARAGGANKKFRNTLSRKTKAYRGREGTIPADLDEQWSRETFIESCLLGWKNVKIHTSEDFLPFTPENAKKVFEAMPDLYKDLVSRAQGFESFQREIGKN